MSRFFYALICLTIFACVVNSRANLWWPDYSATHPLKIMAIGDSITDDCEYNGAWRQYLQPFLEANGYVFEFVGRQSSLANGDFTQVNHEGYCGAVIAPPGMLNYDVHGYPGPDVYLQTIVPDALTNATPDLILLLIGANDIGRGRNPWTTATNDMSQLLDSIYSNAPNANVVLAKITSLQNANVAGMNYGSNVTRVPIYNAALQSLVNQRQARGQQVFLADMFSVVDYNTMFNPDHVHPNNLGLQAVAQEWLTRIQSITEGGSPTLSVLVKGGERWSYYDRGIDLGTNWMRLDYDDSSWSNGLARLGYGDQEAVTKVGYGPVATNKFSTTYFRHRFVLPAGVTFTNLVLRLAQEYGSVVYLNGRELWRTNLPAGPIAYTNLALTKPAGFDAPYRFNPVKVDASLLASRTNVIAVELHQLTPAAPVEGFDMELIGVGAMNGPPSLSLNLTAGNLNFHWPAVDGHRFELYETSNLLSGNWLPVGATMSTNDSQIVVTQAVEGGIQYFRLQNIP